MLCGCILALSDGGGDSSEGGKRAGGYVIPPHLPGGGGLQFVGRWFIRSATEIDDEIIVSGCVYSRWHPTGHFYRQE